MPHDHGHHHHHDVERDHHKNPVDFEAFLARLDDPARDEWQQPDRVVAALRLTPGMNVAEVGSGAGYFALRMAGAVGPTGAVYGLDVEPRMLGVLAERAEKAGFSNVHPVLSDGDTAPPAPCDRILLANTFHHVHDRAALLRRLATALTSNGVIVILDFAAGELPIGPPADHRLSREDALASARDAGLRLVHEETFLPYQYWLELGR